MLARVRLATDELARGPWVYARQIERVEAEDSQAEPVAGAIVEVLDRSGRFLGHALHNPASDIALRWLSRGRKNALERPGAFLLERLRAADQLRRKLLRLEQVSDTYRIVHAEGDDLSGLIVDRLNRFLVCEYHALGFWRLRAEIEAALGELYPGCQVVHRVPKAARAREGFPAEAEAAADAAAAPAELHEHGATFFARPGQGHKTGWFCDQRENRVRVAALCQGREVLDLCCNAGGFAVQAARAGARRVRAVDLDENALALARQAAEHNQAEIEFLHADAFDVLRAEVSRSAGPRADVLILDPHKLILSKADLESGKRKYSDFNTLAFQAVRPGGLVASFSCSGALDLAGFLGVLFSSARRAGRDLKLLELLAAGADHPQRPDFPRSRYLKGALCALDR